MVTLSLCVGRVHCFNLAQASVSLLDTELKYLIEQSKEIGELTMDVTTDLDWRLDLDKRRLLEEQLVRQT